MVALLGHEPRTPLTAICNGLQVLRRGNGDAATREWVLDMLDRQTGRMDCLIEALLDSARISNGQATLVKRSVDLAQLVGFVIETAQPQIDERGHALEVSLPPKPVSLAADPTRLEQVLTNLLVNAAKFTDPGGRIRLKAMPEGNDVVIRVEDNGIGIAPEMLPHIFDLFWQSSRIANHSQGGLGIGLTLVRQIVTLVRQIVALHGGIVSAFSAGPGQGSEFVVRLPRNSAPGTPQDGTPFARR